MAVPTRAVLVFSILCQCASAATYYISPAGNDSNPGTSSQPYLTISRGVKQAVAGDTIIVGDGTYGNNDHISDGSGGMSGYAAPVTISTAGTANAWITLKAQNKGKAILDCGTTATSMGCDRYITVASTAAYWSFQDLVITRGAWGGIGSDVGSSNIRITGCEIHHIGNWNDTTTIGEDAIGFPATTSNWWVEGNLIHDIGRIPYSNLDHGMYAEGSNITVINNVFYNITGGWAIQLANGATNWLIANNTFALPNQSAGGGHIMMWNSNTNITIRNNIFSNSASVQSYAIQRYTSTVNGCYVDHNLIYGATSVIASTTGCTLSNNSIGPNPTFTNISSLPYDFHVLAGAPGIDAGTTVASVTVDKDQVPRPQGIAYDLGAYELPVGGTPTGPTISSVFTSGVTSSAAVINWSTDQSSTSAVQYGLSSYTSTGTTDPAMVSQHSYTITGLQPSTTYHFRAVSQNASNIVGYSSDSTFTTSATPATISLTPSAPAVSVTAGYTVTPSVTAALVAGTPGNVSFSTGSLPAGVAASFSTPACNPTCTSVLSLVATLSATAGTYPIAVTAGNGATSASTTVNLTINNASILDYKSGLAGLWDFSEGRGNTTADSSGNGNTGTLINVSWSKNVCSGCVSFNGRNAYIKVPESNSLEVGQQMTVSMWLSPTATSATDPRMISKLYDWEVKLNGANHYPQFSAGPNYFMLNYSMPLGVWQHLTFTFANGVVKGYVNGVPISANINTFVAGSAIPTYLYGLYLGTDSGATAFYGGLMDDVRIYNRVLTDADVAALYSNTLH